MDRAEVIEDGRAALAEARANGWTLGKRLRNIGGWADFGKIYPGIGVKTPLGNLIVKRWSDRLFSERYGPAKGLRLGSIYIRWVTLRSFRPLEKRHTRSA